MPPKKKQKTKAVNWESSDDESSSEEIVDQESSEEKIAEKVEKTEKAENEPDQKNPYLLTKGEGSFDDNKTVFVGQLPKSMTAPQIRALFSKCGDISRVVVMKFKDTGKPMGSAFVEFDQVLGANNAIKMNGESFKGRKLRINMSSQKPSKPALHAALPSRDRDSRLVYMGNLNFKTERAQIIQFFKHCGKIQSIDIPLWKDSGKKRGFAMVEFLDAKSVNGALKMDGKDLDGRPVVVQLRIDNRGTKEPKQSPRFSGKKRPRKGNKTSE